MTRMLKSMFTTGIALVTITSLIAPAVAMPLERQASSLAERAEREGLLRQVQYQDGTDDEFLPRDRGYGGSGGSRRDWEDRRDGPRYERPRNGVDDQSGWVQERPRDYDPERGARERPRDGHYGQSGVVRDRPRDYDPERGARERPRDGHYGQSGRVRDRDGYYNGHRGSRERRPGYRERDGYWYPLAAFAVGAIIGGAVNGNNNRAAPAYGGSHTDWCANRWRSYRVSDNSYQPSNGPRRECVSPYMR